MDDSASSYRGSGNGATLAPNTRAWRYRPASLHPTLLALIVFQNLYNAFSPYLTLVLNLGMLVGLMLRNRVSVSPAATPIIAAALAILGWLFVAVTVSSDADPQVLLKYVRSAAAIVLFALIFGSCTTPERLVVKAINFAFSFHILLIAIQVVWPDTTSFTAVFFGFAREESVLKDFAMRKLGASSSYDTASLFSIAGLLFFAMQFVQTKKLKYLLAVVAAFAAALMSSRLGMAIALIVVIFFCLRLIWTASLGGKVISLISGGVIVAAAYITLVPLLFHSLGISELQPDDAVIFFSATDYGTSGTLEALTQHHLEPLNQPFLELVLGYAVDPNTIGRFTDIGYVKFIYHVGIVGTVLILVLHFYILVVAHSIANRSELFSDRRLLANFLLFFIVITAVFNYKSLELYSRGTGDFIFLLFFCLVRSEDVRFVMHPLARSPKQSKP